MSYDVECCGVMLHVAVCHQLMTKDVEDECCTRTYDVASCTRMLQVVVGCLELPCDAVCCSMTSIDVVSHTGLLVGFS